MATETLSPWPKAQFFDNNGKPLVGGKLFTYIASTTTKLATYVDSFGLSPNTNPIILDYRGECRLWIPPNVAYKYTLAPADDTDPPTNAIWTVDQIVNSQLLTLYGGIDTGSANTYILNFVANFTSYTDGIVIYWIPSNSNTGASTVNVNGLGPVSIENQDGTALLANQIVANNIVTMMYRGTGFILLDSGFSQSRVAFKATSTDRSSTTTLAPDPVLQIPLQADTAYVVEVFLLFTGVTTGTQGFKYGLGYTGSFTTIGASQGIQTVNTTPAVAIPGALDAEAFATIVSGGGVDGVSFKLFINTNTAGVLSVDWAQNSSSANASRLITGSFISAIRINQ